jgi:hypothetical protein
MKQYSLLSSYLLPLVQGLNASEGAALEQALAPFLKAPDPAKAILDAYQNGIAQKLKDLLAALFPGLNQNLRVWVPSKQLFSAQVFQGRSDKNIHSVTVVEDYPGTPAMVIRATREEAYRLIQLPNIGQLVWRSK